MWQSIGLLVLGVVLTLVLALYGQGTFSNVESQAVVIAPLSSSQPQALLHQVDSRFVASDLTVSHATSAPDNAREWLDLLLHTTIPDMNIPSDHLLIMSAHCAIVTYLQAQWESLVKFVQVPFTFIVLNDTKKQERPDRYYAIEKYCRENRIRHIPIPQFVHDQRVVLFPDTEEPGCNFASCRASTGVQIMLEVFKLHAGYALVLDSDASLIRALSPETILPRDSPYTYTAMNQSREGKTRTVDYIWIPFMLFDMTRFPHPEWMNVDCGRIDDVGVDTGGHWNDYLEKTKHTSLPKPVGDESSSWDVITQFKTNNPNMCLQFSEFYAGCVFHAHNGSGWDPAFNEAKQMRRAEIFRDFVRDRIRNS